MCGVTPLLATAREPRFQREKVAYLGGDYIPPPAAEKGVHVAAAAQTAMGGGSKPRPNSLATWFETFYPDTSALDTNRHSYFRGIAASDSGMILNQNAHMAHAIAQVDAAARDPFRVSPRGPAAARTGTGTGTGGGGTSDTSRGGAGWYSNAR